jgi:ADP-ribose pyrophosphatase YjhB (NUDIX family)
MMPAYSPEVMMQVCARAVILSQSGCVLLIRVGTGRGDLWITPGGRVEPGETPRAAALREVKEETGQSGMVIGQEIWIREWTYRTEDDRAVPEREHFFVVSSDEFEPSDSGMEAEERMRHREFRWWSIAEIRGSEEPFAPPGLGRLLEDLRRSGPPARPLVIRE